MNAMKLLSLALAVAVAASVAGCGSCGKDDCCGKEKSAKSCPAGCTKPCCAPKK